MELRDKNVLITGGTSGIGRELTLALADAGARVLACGTSPDRVEALRRDAAGRGTVGALCCDVSADDAADVLASAVDASLGQLDMLIHCAGIQQHVDLVAGASSDGDGAAQIADIERELDVNLLAPMRITLALLPRLLVRREAVIANVTSVLAFAPKKCAPIYCASKAGLASWTTTLRYQLSETNVRVVEVVPPLVSTKMTQGRDAGAMDPVTLAGAVVAGLRDDRDVIRVGKAKLAHVLHRVAPGLLASQMRDAQ